MTPETAKISNSRVMAASYNKETKVDIDGFTVTWNKSDVIRIAQVADNGQFSSYYTYNIDANSISDDGLYAEFTGTSLTKGEKYIAYNYINTGYVASSSSYNITKHFFCAYGYGNYDKDAVDLIMQSNIFEYDGESLPQLTFEYKSALLDISISVDSDSKFSGKIESLEISSSMEQNNIFLYTLIFNSSGESVYAFYNDVYLYGDSDSIELEFNDGLTLNATTPVTLKVPLTWNQLNDAYGSFLFTIKTTDGSECVVAKPMQVLQDGTCYTADLTFDINAVADVYESTDYTNDGEVMTLQAATVGDGINLVILGDGFIDSDMETGGVYETRMNEAMEHFFSVEPYTTYRNRFNVYTVKAVSQNSEVNGVSETTFSCEFGEGTHISGDNTKVFEYAIKVPSITNTNNLPVIVVLNSHNYAGTCWMYYGNDASIAYCPIAYNSDEMFRQLITHEAGGHGFAKLLDEYAYSGTIPDDAISSFEYEESIGWGANVDVTSDSSAIQWSHFLSDSRYTGLVGIYEGALTYEFGAYRPTDVSIMRYNTGGYNAPSREAIYKNIMVLSGDEYDYEEFVAYDAINRTSSSQAYRAAAASTVNESTFVPLAQPVIVKGRPYAKSVCEP